jgi:hypothetical protein
VFGSGSGAAFTLECGADARAAGGQAMPEGSRTRRRRDDHEVALLLGENCGLGEVRVIALARKYWIAFWGGLLALVAGIAGIPAIAGDAGWAKVINAAVFGSLFPLGCLVLGLGIARAPVTGRLFWHSGGLAELAGDEPEPRIVRWADVETVTTVYYEGEETPIRLTGCILGGGAGTEPVDLRGPAKIRGYRSSVLRALTMEAARILAPRLVRPLIGAYESGEPVTVGEACIDRSGITVKPPDGERIAWTEIRSITTRHVTSFADGAAPVYEIEICKQPGNMCREISLDGVANGMFLPHLLAHAAAQYGVSLRTSPRYLPLPWPTFSEQVSKG